MRGQPRNASRNKGGGDGDRDGEWLWGAPLAPLDGAASPLPPPAALRGVDDGDGTASGVTGTGDTIGSRLELSVCTCRVGWGGSGGAAVTTGERAAEAAALPPSAAVAAAALLSVRAAMFVSSFAGGVTSSDMRSAGASESDMAEGRCAALVSGPRGTGLLVSL